jgi:hypothetical protein
MKIVTIYDSFAVTAAVGTTYSTGSRDVQKGIATCEVSGTGSDKPQAKVYGKLIKSDDAEIDSGWIELQEWSSIADNSAQSTDIDVYPYMSVDILGNDDTKRIQVNIAYTNTTS